jgi:glucose/arabinose dehydrogenase
MALPFGPSQATAAFLPDGHLLVADKTSGTIVEMNADGSGQSLWATGLHGPEALAVAALNPQSGYVYVAEAGHRRGGRRRRAL